MSRACVCGGSNENCHYCSGRGEIPDRLANALMVHTHLPESQKVHLGAGGRSLKQISFTPKRLNKIKALIEALRKPFTPSVRTVERPRVPTPAPSPSQLVPCPRRCGALLERGAIAAHLQHKHPAVTDLPNLKRGDSGTPTNEYEVCPTCKCKVKTYRLKRHLRKVHKKSFRRSRRDTPIANSAKDVLRDETTFVARREKNLDATKLYAHAYRELGRFGSHPSHDGFDDESGPD
jgi:hypothetical protein